MSDLGTMALMCSLALSLYGTVIPHFGVRSNTWNLVRSVQHASILSFFLIAVASVVLVEALVNSDFSIHYVWGHSSRDMPLFYKITSFWGGLEGSLLFWVLVQSFFIMIVAFILIFCVCTMISRWPAARRPERDGDGREEAGI